MASERVRLVRRFAALLMLFLLGFGNKSCVQFIKCSFQYCGHAVVHHPHRAAKVLRLASEDDADSALEDTTNVELFRQSLIQGWGAGEVGDSTSRGALTDWAELVDPADIRAGDVLLGNPALFFGAHNDTASAAAMKRVGLNAPLPDYLSQRERLRVLPVVLLTNIDNISGTAQGLLLTRRTGQLMGDFVNHFFSRPLMLGGPIVKDSDDLLIMVHSYPQVAGSQKLEDSGLYVGNSSCLASATEWVEEGEGSSLRFKFFLSSMQWGPGEVLAELAQPRAWVPLRCSPDLVLSESDSLDDKPLWVKIAELAGGEIEELGQQHDLM